MANIDRHSLIPVLILSLVFSVVPLNGITLNLRSGSVNGWLDDLFGGSKSEDTTSRSSYAIYAEFEAIDGESMEADRKNWIDLDSFEFSMGVPGTISGTSRRSWDVVVNEIIITKRVDKSTPKLMEALTSGTVISEVIIEVTTQYGDKKTFYRYELTNVLVTSYLSSGETGSTEPTDILTLNFEEIKVIYTEFDSKGSAKGNIEWTWRIEEAEA